MRHAVSKRLFHESGFTVHQIEGNSLTFNSVGREHIGAYFCIAWNGKNIKAVKIFILFHYCLLFSGYPPTVSKRIELDVECKYFFLFFTVVKY